MFKEGYLGTGKLFVGPSRHEDRQILGGRVEVILLNQVDDHSKIRVFANALELRNAAAMMIQAADQLDK